MAGGFVVKMPLENSTIFLALYLCLELYIGQWLCGIMSGSDIWNVLEGWVLFFECLCITSKGMHSSVCISTSCALMV